MIESDEISELQNHLDWIIGRKPAVKRKRVHRPLRITEYNIRSLFKMSKKELLYTLCRELGYVIVKRKSSIKIIK